MEMKSRATSEVARLSFIAREGQGLKPKLTVTVCPVEGTVIVI